MKVPGARRVLPPVAAAVVLAAVYGLATYVRPAAFGPSGQVRSPRSAAVSSVVRGCPSAGSVSAARVAVIAATSKTGPGRAVVSRLGAPGSSPLLRLTHPGQLSVQLVKATRSTHAGAQGSAAGRSVSTAPAQGGVVVRASGSMAGGLEAEQVAAGAVPGTRCVGPGTDFWFVGPGDRTVKDIQLFLMNVGTQPADVGAELSTDAGPLQGSTDTGIAVAPHAMVVQSLAPVLHGSQVVAVHVLASVGQVVAAVEETKGGGRGGAWLPVAASPATHVVLPGLPGTAGTPEVYLAVPGASDARIHLTAITTRGSYQPTGAAGLDIPGGSAVAIPLQSLTGIPAAIKISSNVPLTASAMLPGGVPGAPGAFTAASAPVEEQGVVAENQDGSGETSQLVLSAPGHAVRAAIRVTGQGGSAPAASVTDVQAGHTVVVQLRRPHGSHGGSGFSVVVTPLAGSGPLYAGRVIQSSKAGTVEAVLPVASALTTVPLPSVREAFISAGP